jgi:hypothetical protein
MKAGDSFKKINHYQQTVFYDYFHIYFSGKPH